jgi:hypothetical protein
MQAANRAPYVGPRAFQREEMELFFGRSRETRNLGSLVVAHPIVVLYAASGAGKSSLLNAGLVPLLEEARGCEVLPTARVSGRLPTALKDHEVDNVYAFNVLSSWADPGVDPRGLLHVDIAGFLAARPPRKDEVGERVLRVVILDQFEELFTFAPERWREREGSIRQLGSALEADPLLRVVLAMREEFIGQLGTYASLLQGARTRFHLEPLGPEAAEQAVAEPLKRTGREIEPAATQRLVQELLKIRVRGVGGETIETLGPFVEPVQLQVACTKLWDDLPADVQTITPAHLKTFGDVNEALKQFFEEALSAAVAKTGISNDRLRSWVDHYLITPGGTRGMVYRGAESTGSEEEAIPNAAVDVLEEKHVIRAEARAGGERWYELTHDRFIEPIKESIRVWKENARRRRLKRAAVIVTSVVTVIFVTISMIPIAMDRYVEYQCADKPLADLLDFYRQNPEGAEATAPRILDNIAACLWDQNKLDRLAKLLQRAEPLIGDYGADTFEAAVLPRVAQEEKWPIELQYNPHHALNADLLLYEWRKMAMSLVDLWGIPAPAAMKLREDETIPVDYVVVVAGEARRPVRVPSLPGFVLITENRMSQKLHTWFEARKGQWVHVESLTQGGPWWLVPRFIHPLFKVAHHPASPREALIAVLVADALIAQPELALNRHNVVYLLRRIDEKGARARTVAEAMAARGGIDGLVEDLRAIVAKNYSLLTLEYVLDSLAGFAKSEFPSTKVADLVIEDQVAAVPRIAVKLAGAPPAAPTESLAELARAADARPYRDTADRIDAESQPVRIHLGKDLRSNFLAPEGELSPEVLEALSDLRAELFKRFGIVVPGVRFRESGAWDPTLAPDAFRIELLNQTQENLDAAPIKPRAPEDAVKEVLNELPRRLLTLRSWWITADYLDEHLGPSKESNERSESKEFKAWLLSRYTLTDIKMLLRSVVAPTDAELEAFSSGGVDSALRFNVPGQSLRQLDWLLASLAFWSQAHDRLDTAQLAMALRDTQAGRLAPSLPSPPDSPATAAVFAGIDALEQRDYLRAEVRFHEALAADRRGAIAAFKAAYPRRGAKSVAIELNELTEACMPFERPGRLNERRSILESWRYEIEDFLAHHQDAISEPDRARLEYCLLEHYSAKARPAHVRAGLEKFGTAQYSGQLEPNQKYALGYWTLELSGQSIDLPTDQRAAETWLTSAFKEWKETTQDEASVGDAFSELLRRYGGKFPPRWYMDMLKRLAELRPKNFDIAFDLGDTLSGGRDMADADEALIWLARARDRIDEPGVAEADRPRLSAWIAYSVARAYLTKAGISAGKASEEAALAATSRLAELIRRLKNGGVIGDRKWPGVEAYGTLIDIYNFRNQFDQAAKVLDASRQDGLIESPGLLSIRVVLLLAAGRADEALQVAQRGLEMQGVVRANALFLAALSQLLANKPEAEFAARQFLATDHEYRDYVRLMLYWYLVRQEKVDQAKAYLDERWSSINQASWPARLARGDPQVWREQLIGYYLGQVRRNDIFAPLSSPEAFETSGLNRIGIHGLTFEGMRCEANFYDALLQHVTGEPATRAERYSQTLGRVLEVGHGNMYEYVMARYLRSRG